ncbi:MAG: exodeoxyribonuclease VII large subunit [Methylophilaceae bacterium]
MSDDLFSTPPQVFSVTQLNRMIRELLEGAIPLLWVSGEISNLTRAASGHWYFSLKDANAQVRCVMFRQRNAYLGWQPKEGDKIEARALVSLYEARGEFQLTIEFLQKAGLGTLYEAFEKLKQKLELEGLFAPEKKRALPAFPKQIGIVTSPDAAALQDVLTTLKRRMPSIPIVIYPTPVQGKGAAETITAAINSASKRKECDVLIVCRGGGSMEDLWSFNEEIVARAIAGCAIPVVSGVGHETDFTIADFAADRRAPTPTAAAEMVSPDRVSLLQSLGQMQNRLNRQMRFALSERAQKLDGLARRLVHPGERIRQRGEQLAQLHARFSYATQRNLEQRQTHLHKLAQNLEHLAPQQVLKRGYSLVHNGAGEIVRNSTALKIGENLNITLAQGSVDASVSKTHPPPNLPLEGGGGV